MLNKSISVSLKVSDLSQPAQTLYTWAISHSDDFGLLPQQSKKIKGLVVPFWDNTLQEVEEMIDEILGQGLWVPVMIEGGHFYAVTNWFEHQDLRKDIAPKLYINKKVDWSEYKKIEEQIIAYVTDRNDPSETVVEDKGREVKLSEVKLSERETPAQQMRRFVKAVEEHGDDWLAILKSFPEESRPFAETEIKKFVMYWTEPTKSGKKQRWETEKTFDVKRRLSTWFSRADKYNKHDTKGRINKPNFAQL